MDWVQDIIKEYIIKNQIPTTAEQIQKLAEYYTAQGILLLVWFVML